MHSVRIPFHLIQCISKINVFTTTTRTIIVQMNVLSVIKISASLSKVLKQYLKQDEMTTFLEKAFKFTEEEFKERKDHYMQFQV